MPSVPIVIAPELGKPDALVRGMVVALLVIAALRVVEFVTGDPVTVNWPLPTLAAVKPALPVIFAHATVLVYQERVARLSPDSAI